MRSVTADELAKVIADHNTWLCSVTYPREGVCANLSYANLRGADLSYANLSYANLRGANLRDANLSYANLRGANLRGANLRDANLSDANLSYANLSYANLSYANLRGANLRDANLRDANLRGADLSYADLSYAKNIDLTGIPLIENLDAKILAAVESDPSSFNMSNWHEDVYAEDGNACGTSHCRAGWAIHMAGDAGKVLERFVGPGTAGALIYLKSTGRVPDFFCSNQDALEDIRRCAAESTNAGNANG